MINHAKWMTVYSDGPCGLLNIGCDSVATVGAMPSSTDAATKAAVAHAVADANLALSAAENELQQAHRLNDELQKKIAALRTETLTLEDQVQSWSLGHPPMVCRSESSLIKVSPQRGNKLLSLVRVLVYQVAENARRAATAEAELRSQESAHRMLARGEAQHAQEAEHATQRLEQKVGSKTLCRLTLLLLFCV